TLVAALSPSAAALNSLVASMQGLVEMTLLVCPSTQAMLRELKPVIPAQWEPSVRGAGRQYLESVRERSRPSSPLSDRVVARLNAAVAPWIRKAAGREPPTRHVLLSIA